jgi:hypothetical protein
MLRILSWILTSKYYKDNIDLSLSGKNNANMSVTGLYITILLSQTKL